MPFYEELRTRQNIVPEDFIGARFEMKFGRVVGENKLNEENPDDIIEEMLSNNAGYGKEYDEENNEIIVMFEHEIPLHIFKKYFVSDKPIMKDGNI